VSRRHRRDLILDSGGVSTFVAQAAESHSYCKDVADLTMKQFLAATAIAAASLSSASQAAPADGRAGATAASRAMLRTFAGTWIGHTRSLKITSKGVATEAVGSGCCDPVIDLELRLSHPRGTTNNASARARVVAVDIHDAGAFTSSDPAPRVGQTKRLRLRNGVITEPFIGTNYCDPRAGRKGTCGA
jgi:hypothetical protein